MVCIHDDLIFASLQVMSPFLEGGNDGEEFFVVDFVIDFGFVEFSGVECYWVHFFVNYLGEDTAKGIIAGVCFDHSLVFWCEMTKDWSCCKERFECGKGLLLFGSPVKVLGAAFELVGNWLTDCRKILDKPTIKVGKAHKDLNIFNVS